MAQLNRLDILPVLMEDESCSLPTPSGYLQRKSSMNSDHSAPKRKRDSRDGVQSDLGEAGIHTPKRSRSRMKSVEEDATPARQRSIRRKRGVRNLSDLSLQQATDPDPDYASPRESKFQEGSFTDKPSEAPPSLFTRMARTESGNLLAMDELMANYNAAEEGARSSTIDSQNSATHATFGNMSAEAAAVQHGTGFFRFGRSIAANFHPVTLWNRIWNEQKEELTRQNMLDAERRARLKTEAEARYTEMKQAGQFEYLPSAALAGSGDMSSTPYDSAVSLDNQLQPHGHKRMSSDGSQLSLGHGINSSHDEADLPDTASKTLRSIRSRLYLKRPSLSNLRNDLKRVKSDLNIGSCVQPDSSSSSPVKTDIEGSALRRSHSKYDLKKQHKLSKRVSDLELKLRQARKELEDALAEASPAARLFNSNDRFIPTPTLRRPKFIPGRLPTLPSERLLLAEQQDIMDCTGSGDGNATVSVGVDSANNEETIKAPRERQNPVHVSALFQSETDVIAPESNNVQEQSALQVERTSHQVSQTSITPNMNFSDMDASPHEGISTEPKKSGYTDLDRKLKALDQSYRASKKSTTSKKRKLGVGHDDAAFKLGRDEVDNDDAEWEEANSTPQKKRKPLAAKSRSGKGTTGNATSQTTDSASLEKGKKAEKQARLLEKQLAEADGDANRGISGQIAEEDVSYSSELRSSLDVQPHQLEPLYEEEEEMITVPLKDEPSRPTAKATPARYGRPRSFSPHKQLQTVEDEAETADLAHADGAEQVETQSREAIALSKGKDASTGKADKAKRVQARDLSQSLERVDELPESRTREKSAAGVRTKKKKRNEAFQWPDDVF